VRRRWSRSSRLYLTASLALALAAAMLTRTLASRAAASSATGPQIPVVVAAAHVARGSPLSASDLRLTWMPEAYVPPGSYSRTGQASGRVALADLSPGEAVTKTRLARVRAGPVASLIPEGLRAFAVPTNLPAGAVVPGDRVDVLATYGSGQPHTEVVVSAVEVLGVLGPSGTPTGAGGTTSGVAMDAAGSGASGSTTLILLVSPEDEGRLAYARAFADLQVAIAPVSG
jgi:Flp pilus assembly protein CpaB